MSALDEAVGSIYGDRATVPPRPPRTEGPRSHSPSSSDGTGRQRSVLSLPSPLSSPDQSDSRLI